MKATRRSQILAGLALLSIIVSLCVVPSGSHASAKAVEGARFEALAAYAQDLTKAARGAEAHAEDFGAGVRRVMQVLSRRGGRNNPVLVGTDAAAGAGVVEGLARRIAAGGGQASFRGERGLRLDAGGLLGGGGGAGVARRVAAGGWEGGGFRGP